MTIFTGLKKSITAIIAFLASLTTTIIILSCIILCAATQAAASFIIK